MQTMHDADNGVKAAAIFAPWLRGTLTLHSAFRILHFVINA
jgi:hypothetical protein